MQRPWSGPLAVAAITFLVLIAQLDVADDSSLLPDGPGLTLDEGFNVEVGVYLVQGTLSYGVSIIHPESLRELFSDPDYNPDHPPLGRWLLGWSEYLGRSVFGERPGPPMYVLTYARFAPALAFAVNVFLVGWYTAKWRTVRAGRLAALALALMPRAFGHAHLASLETFMGLAYSAVLLVAADWWTPASPPRRTSVLLIGVLLGLAFLTKIQAIFLPPILLVWMVWNWRAKAVSYSVLLGLVAFAVFFLGWPWLWLDPVDHVREYFARTTERQTLYCQYFGVRYADRDVPWPYPPVMFLISMPLGTLLLGLTGFLIPRLDGQQTSLWTSPRWQLLGMGWIGPVVSFMLPGIALYDGIRLFLVSLPLFAVFVGCGADLFVDWLSKRLAPRMATCTAAGAICVPLLQIWLLSPCWLSYYSEGIGGLAGARQLGCELNYWGDALTPELIREVCQHLPEGTTLDVAPVLHPSQLSFFMRHQTQLRLRPDIQLRGYDPSLHSDIRYVLVLRRLADPWDSLSPPPAGSKVLASTVREGVTLAELLELAPQSALHLP